MRSILMLFPFIIACSADFSDDDQPWLYAIAHQETPTGITNLNASTCGTCHVDHHNEWQNSAHALAWEDEQFQAEFVKPESPYFCVNCHTPLQNQQEKIITGYQNLSTPILKNNPKFDPTLQKEGINCATCHVRDGFIIVNKKNISAPHPVKYNPELLNEKLCLSCHNQTAKINAQLICTFETGDEWRAAPIKDQKNCISCHMPLDTGNHKKHHFHGFPGSGIPKNKNIPTNGLNGIQHVIRNNFNDINLTIINRFAGHNIPTGDPERYIIMQLIAYKNGKIVNTVNHKIGETWLWHPKAIKLNDNNLKPGDSASISMTTGDSDSIRAIVEKYRISPENAAYHNLSTNYPLSSIIFDSTFRYYK